MTDVRLDGVDADVLEKLATRIRADRVAEQRRQTGVALGNLAVPHWPAPTPSWRQRHWWPVRWYLHAHGVLTRKLRRTEP
jgi:hypothetical protein